MSTLCTTSLSKQRGSALSHLHAKSLYSLTLTRKPIRIEYHPYVLCSSVLLLSIHGGERERYIGIGLYHPLPLYLSVFRCSRVEKGDNSLTALTTGMCQMPLLFFGYPLETQTIEVRRKVDGYRLLLMTGWGGGCMRKTERKHSTLMTMSGDPN